MKIFDWLNEITYKKRPWDSFSEADQKTFNTFIISFLPWLWIFIWF